MNNKIIQRKVTHVFIVVFELMIHVPYVCNIDKRYLNLLNLNRAKVFNQIKSLFEIETYVSLNCKNYLLCYVYIIC